MGIRARIVEVKSAKSMCEDCNINSIDVDGKWTVNLSEFFIDMRIACNEEGDEDRQCF